MDEDEFKDTAEFLDDLNWLEPDEPDEPDELTNGPDIGGEG